MHLPLALCSHSVMHFCYVFSYIKIMFHHHKHNNNIRHKQTHLHICTNTKIFDCIFCFGKEFYCRREYVQPALFITYTLIIVYYYWDVDNKYMYEWSEKRNIINTKQGTLLLLFYGCICALHHQHHKFTASSKWSKIC